jgi:hypothetical protein
MPTYGLNTDLSAFNQSIPTTTLNSSLQNIYDPKYGFTYDDTVYDVLGGKTIGDVTTGSTGLANYLGNTPSSGGDGFFGGLGKVLGNNDLMGNLIGAAGVLPSLLTFGDMKKQLKLTNEGLAANLAAFKDDRATHKNTSKNFSNAAKNLGYTA